MNGTRDLPWVRDRHLDRGEALGDAHCPVALPLLIHIHEAALPHAELRLAAAEQPAERRDGGGSVALGASALGGVGAIVDGKTKAFKGFLDPVSVILEPKEEAQNALASAQD